MKAIVIGATGTIGKGIVNRDDASPLTDIFGGGDLGGLADKVGGFFN
jgi:hypothetical protein